MIKEIKNFLLHLRLNYNFLILSAPFFLGAFYPQGIVDVASYIFAFLLVYVLLFGGANAYNSYFDKDEGPIGGLEHPPEMKKWMYWSSWFLQLAGIALSFLIGFEFGLLFMISVVMFWLYSGPLFRFKGKPILSFLVIGIGTVFNVTLMGYFAAGGVNLSFLPILGALGATSVVLGMYPFSQAYQIDEDTRRGDVTFAAKYGVRGIKSNYLILFPVGILLLSLSLYPALLLQALFFIFGVCACTVIWHVVGKISGHKDEYKTVMRTKYYSGLMFTLIMFVLLFIGR
jgi:4-hydroxybenzoate polyprenyltransferase